MDNLGKGEQVMAGAGENSYLSIINALEEGVYFLDKQRNITYWNRAAEKITGYSATEIIGRSCKDNILVHVNEQGVNLCQNLCPVVSTIHDGVAHSANVYLHHKNGHRVSVHVRTFPLRNERDEIIGVAEVFSDNSFQRIEINKIQELMKYSFIDEATGCYNQRYARSKISSMMKETHDNEIPFAILLVKIINYRQVNEKLGLNLGEIILSVAVKTTQSAIDLDKIVCRWKDDQIMVLIPNARPVLIQGYVNKLAVLLQESFVSVATEKRYPIAKIGHIMVNKFDQLDDIMEKIESLMKEPAVDPNASETPAETNAG